jgi:hypothetical protein
MGREMSVDIMVLMRRLLPLVAISATFCCAADLSSVRTVYMLPMAKSLDQYLANRLTNEHLFQVVTDPTKADAIFTDRIGEGFEQKLADMLAEPEEETKEAPTKTETKQPDDARGDISPVGQAPVNKLSKPGSTSTMSRAKGTVFLVNAKTHEVVWSAYEPPKDSTSRQMDRTASLLVNRMKRELNGK